MEQNEVKNQNEVNNLNELKSAKPRFWDKVKAHKGAAIGVAVGLGAALLAGVAHVLTARQNDDGMIEDISETEESSDEE